MSQHINRDIIALIVHNGDITIGSAILYDYRAMGAATVVTGHIFPTLTFLGQTINREFLFNAILAVDEGEIILFIVAVLYHRRHKTCPHGIRAIVNKRLSEIAIVSHSHDKSKRQSGHNPVHSWAIYPTQRCVEENQINRS